MTAVDNFPAYAAFEKQLRTLCLREFPCGPGKWRETQAKNIQQLKSKDTVESKYSVTLKDYGPEHEKTETLQEYVSSKYSPWHLDYSWSKEARQLREIAVKSPWLIDDGFILRYFHTIRIVDKNVTDVDSHLLNFINLEELTLSVNHLITVNSKHLPQNLKVLELCANKISDMSALCIKPPPLIHLGLGLNKISFMGDYLTGEFWPYLLSLDLSHNNLSDLLDVVRKLGTLPKLRNLVLQGNPLALIAGYRGYTIDSLRKLSVLDDIMISADERHHYKGLARRREYILDEAKVTLEAAYIKGIPIPEEMKNPDEQPEYPIVERKYYVQFMFFADNTGKTDVLEITHDEFGELDELSPLPTDNKSEYSAEMTSNYIDETTSSLLPPEAAKNVNFTAQPEVVSVREPTAEPDKQTVHAASPKEKDDTLSVSSEGKAVVEKAPIKLGGGTWADEIELNASQLVVRDDLLGLRNFFREGVEFSVVEEVVLCYPKDDSPECGTPTRKGDKKDKKKDEKKDDKGLRGGKDDKKKKKGKEPEMEMKRMAPTYSTLATWHIPLEDLLEGEYQLQSIYTQGGVEVASTIKSVETDKKGGKKDEKDKKKPGSSKKKEEPKGKERRNSVIAKGGKDDKKDKMKGKGGPATVEEEEEDTPPPPLEVHVTVRLHHWKTALDSLKEEEEKNKIIEEQQQG